MQSQEEAEAGLEKVEPSPPVLIKAPGEGIVTMAVSIKEMKERMDLLAQLKKDILTDDDFAEFTVNGKKIKAIRKSGCLKYAVAFNLTTVVVKQEKVWIHEATNQFSWHVVVQCIAQNGRITEEVGVCDNVTDRAGQSEHVIKTMAKTRATSRAIIGMVGTADTTAEDMSSVKDIPKDGKFCQCGDKSRFGENSRVCLECGGNQYTP